MHTEFLALRRSHVIMRQLPEMLYVRSEYRKAGIGTQLLEYLEKESGCTSSMIFYNTTLHNYYAKRGYTVGENLETAMKSLVPAEKRTNDNDER